MSAILPVGIQDFEGLINDGYIYVDKSEYIYRLVHEGKPYFLSRPRRFGKSLLLSTIKAYWEGKKEVFSGLAIEKLEEHNEKAWRKHPVFYFDFNGESYKNKDVLKRKISFMLNGWEKEYNIVNENNTLSERFQILLKTAKEKTGLRCVILVDEYDKPLLDVIDNEELTEHNKEIFKGFFSTLKSFDEYIQFILITGVSKFHKVSIFSDLNQLNDISLDEDYACLCGITEEELRHYFDNEIKRLSEKRRISYEECVEKLKRQYDGYRFHPDAAGVFNPYSLLKAFFSKDFGSYWFETGTPNFLVQKLKDIEFDVRKFTDRTLYASEGMLKDYTGDSLATVPLLYQTGYLTIADFDRDAREYTLAFPNEEVKYGFVECLMPEYISDCGAGSGNDIFTLRRYIEQGDLQQIRNVLVSLFANITYTVEGNPFEHYFQAVIYLVFTLLNKVALCEMHTYTGRIDCKVETKKYIYLFEFKRDDTAEAALNQIDSNDYALPFIANHKKLYKIGVAFDSSTRKLSDWKVEE
ncbi:MAG: ATP-binding protein [Lachnospiraceae bacterium]|nr:ATP-binding protein [Lachnospiraceae bacterium]